MQRVPRLNAIPTTPTPGTVQSHRMPPPATVLDAAVEISAEEEAHQRAVQDEANGDLHTDETGGPVESPIPFDTFERVPFPVHALPDGIREYVEAISASLEIPVDLPGVLVLGALSTAVQGKWTVEPKQGWREPLNLYLAVAMEPGEQKSGAFKSMFGPLWEYEAQLVAAWKAAVTPLEIANAQVKRGDPKVTIPPRPRLFVDDATQETVAQILSQQGERLAVASDEGTIFSIICGLYSKNPNNGVFLKSHDGGRYTVDRRDIEKHVVLRNPLLTMALALQPQMFRLLGSKPELRGQGMVARFLFSQPVSRIGSKDFDGPPVDWEVRDHYRRLILALAGMRPNAWKVPTDIRPLQPGDKPARIIFSEESWDWLKAVCIGIDRQCAPGGRLHLIQDWASKLRGAIARIAGLFHIVRCAYDHVDPESVQLELADLQAAMELGRYFLSQAHKAFATMESDPAEKDAEILGKWMRDHKYLHFTRRDVQRHSPIRKSARIDSALAVLLDRGHLEKVSRIPGSRSSGFKVIPLKAASDVATEGEDETK